MTVATQTLEGQQSADDIRDLISEAISDSLDMDWQPSWGADAVIKALTFAGLIVVPDLAKLCAENGYDYGRLDFYPGQVGSGRWDAAFHRSGRCFWGHKQSADPHAAVDAALSREAEDLEKAA